MADDGVRTCLNQTKPVLLLYFINRLVGLYCRLFKSLSSCFYKQEVFIMSEVLVFWTSVFWHVTDALTRSIQWFWFSFTKKVLLCPFPSGHKQARQRDILHRSQVCAGNWRATALPGHPWRQRILHHQVSVLLKSRNAPEGSHAEISCCVSWEPSLTRDISA